MSWKNTEGSNYIVKLRSQRFRQENDEPHNLFVNEQYLASFHVKVQYVKCNSNKGW